MKKKLLLLILCFSGQMYWAIDKQSQAESYFKEANLLYQKGEFGQAAEVYQQMEQLEVEAAEVYFNLGNCFYKMGQLPQAIFNYEKANICAPFNEKIESNLTVAYDNTHDKIAFKNTATFFTYLKAKLLPYQFWIFAFTMIMAVLSLIALYNHRINRKSSFSFILSSIVLWCFGLVLTLILAIDKPTRIGIVFASQTPVIDINHKQKIRNVHEGTKVIIEEEQGAYLLVHLTDVTKGWVKKEAIKEVD